MPDDSLLAELGDRLRATRILAELSQAELAEQAGISRRTVAKIESGEPVTTLSLMRAMRELGLLEDLDTILPEDRLTPVEVVENKRRRRQRVSRKRGEVKRGDWTWGDGGE